jgi:hypothetical protein
MKRYLLLTGLFVLLACSKPKEAPRQLNLKKLVWSAYNWHLNDSVTQWEFYLSHYVEVKPTGECLIMYRGGYEGEAHLYRTQLSPAFIHQINAAFTNHSYSDSYTQSPEDRLVVYCGPTYCFDFAGETGQQYVTYIPRFLPVELSKLSDSLRTMLHKDHLSRAEKLEGKSLDWLSYAQQLKNRVGITDSLPLPKASEVKFVPPPITE